MKIELKEHKSVRPKYYICERGTLNSIQYKQIMNMFSYMFSTVRDRNIINKSKARLKIFDNDTFFIYIEIWNEDMSEKFVNYLNERISQ